MDSYKVQNKLELQNHIQARVEGDIGDGRRQWRQQIREIGSLTAWDRIARSEQETVVLSQIGDTLSIVWLIDFETQRKFQKEKNFWDRTFKLSGSSKRGEKCVRKTKGEKNKNKNKKHEGFTTRV